MSDDPTPSVDHPPAGPPGDHTPYVRAWAEGRRAAEVADQSARLQAMLDATAEDNDRLRADRDRLSAELAEARRLLRRVVEWYDGCGISSSLFVALEPTLNEALAHLPVKAPCDAAPASVSDRPAETVPELLEQMRGTAPPPEVAAAREAHERRQREPLPNRRIGATAPSERDTPEET